MGDSKAYNQDFFYCPEFQQDSMLFALLKRLSKYPKNLSFVTNF